MLTGATALAPNNVWAVVFYAKDVNTDRPTKTLIEHWDGSSWQVVSSPNIGPHSVYQPPLWYHHRLGQRRLGLR